jgi:hypothetical protein
MRAFYIVAPIALALAGCNTADRTANEVGNAADAAGAAIRDGAEDVGNTARDATEAVGNGIEGAGNVIAAAENHDGWVGRWRGVEGTYLVISKAATPGDYKLEMQYTLDDKGNFDGSSTGDGIAFQRPDGNQVLRASTGDATGLKWLAGKKDCLKVKDGEGYCRD